MERDVGALGLGLREATLRIKQKAEVEVELGARRGLLQLVELLFVREVLIPNGHGALVDEIVDASNDAIGGGFSFGEPHAWRAR